MPQFLKINYAEARLDADLQAIGVSLPIHIPLLPRSGNEGDRRDAAGIANGPAQAQHASRGDARQRVNQRETAAIGPMRE